MSVQLIQGRRLTLAPLYSVAYGYATSSREDERRGEWGGEGRGGEGREGVGSWERSREREGGSAKEGERGWWEGSGEWGVRVGKGEWGVLSGKEGVGGGMWEGVQCRLSPPAAGAECYSCRLCGRWAAIAAAGPFFLRGGPWRLSDFSSTDQRQGQIRGQRCCAGVDSGSGGGANDRLRRTTGEARSARSQAVLIQLRLGDQPH